MAKIARFCTHPFDDIKNIDFEPLSASGGTPLDQAFKLAKDLIEDRDTFPTKFYKPYSILVSDGEPNNDKWQKPLSSSTMMGEALKVCVGAFLLAIEMPTRKLIRILAKMAYFTQMMWKS